MSNVRHKAYILSSTLGAIKRLRRGLRCFKVSLIHMIHMKAVDSVTDPFHHDEVGRGEMRFNQTTPG
jgi:hypothetical protein